MLPPHYVSAVVLANKAHRSQNDTGYNSNRQELVMDGNRPEKNGPKNKPGEADVGTLWNSYRKRRQTQPGLAVFLRCLLKKCLWWRMPFATNHWCCTNICATRWLAMKVPLDHGQAPIASLPYASCLATAKPRCCDVQGCMCCPPLLPARGVTFRNQAEEVPTGEVRGWEICPQQARPTVRSVSQTWRARELPASMLGTCREQCPGPGPATSQV